MNGVAITNGAKEAGIVNATLMSSDALLSSDFIAQTYQATQGMYLSGSAPVEGSQAFIEKYKERYGEEPIATYHLYAYDTAMMLIHAIENASIKSGNTIYIPRGRRSETRCTTSAAIKVKAAH